MKVSKKKYLILMLSTLVIGILLLFFLPEEQKLYVFFLPIFMWIVYSILIYIEQKQRE